MSLPHLLYLLVVEVLELEHTEHAVAVQIEHAKPVLNAGRIALVLLGDQKPDKVIVAHQAVPGLFALDDGARKDAVDHFSRYRVVIMPVEVLAAYEQIVVLVELPEFAVYYVEVFVAEVVLYRVYVVLVLDGFEHRQEIGPLELGERDTAGPGSIEYVIDACDHCLDVSRVELFVVVQKFEARMRVDNVLEQRLPVLVDHGGRANGRHELHEQTWPVVAGRGQLGPDLLQDRVGDVGDFRVECASPEHQRLPVEWQVEKLDYLAKVFARHLALFVAAQLKFSRKLFHDL